MGIQGRIGSATRAVLWLSLTMLLATPEFCAAAVVPLSLQLTMPGDSESIHHDLGLLARQKTKHKKKKKKPSEEPDEAFGPASIAAEEPSDQGSGVHREQEGVDVPYKAEGALLTDLSFMSQKSGDASPVSVNNYSVDVQWLFILGSMEIGPDVAYNSTKTAISTTTKDASNNSTVTVTSSTETGYSVGGIFKWNFGNLDHDDLVPFAYGGLAYSAASTSSDDADTAKSSGTIIKAGGGLNMFIDSNIAFNPSVEYRIATDKSDLNDSSVTTTTSGFKILIGIAVFI